MSRQFNQVRDVFRRSSMSSLRITKYQVPTRRGCKDMVRSWSGQSALVQFSTRGAVSGLRCRSLLLGPRGAAETQQKPTQFWPRYDHIFATVAPLDLKLVPIDRSRRTTSKYIPYLINLARQKFFSEDLMIFLRKFFQNWRKFLKIF